MPHIKLPNQPGIVSLFEYKPSVADRLSLLAQELLRGPSPLLMGERELIAAYTSFQNDCFFCFESHAQVAAILLNLELREIKDIVAGVKHFSHKMKAIFDIVDEVVENRKDGSAIAIAIDSQKLSEAEIHDVVAIASAFCMFNRYVDGLGAGDVMPDELTMEGMAKNLVKHGYEIRTETLAAAGVPQARDEEEPLAVLT